MTAAAGAATRLSGDTRVWGQVPATVARRHSRMLRLASTVPRSALATLAWRPAAMPPALRASRVVGREPGEASNRVGLAQCDSLHETESNEPSIDTRPGASTSAATRAASAA